MSEHRHALSTLQRELADAERALPDLRKKVKSQEGWLGDARRALWGKETRVRSLKASIATLEKETRA